MPLRDLLASMGVLLAAQVALALPPSNDECANALVIPTVPYTITLDTSEATAAPSDPILPCLFGDPGTRSVWFSYTAPADVQLLVDISRSASTYPVVVVHRGTCGALDIQECSDDGSENAMPIPVGVAAGETLLFEVVDGEGSIALDVTTPSPGTPALLGGELQVNTFTAYREGGYLERGVSTCADAVGNFVVVWQTAFAQDGSSNGVFAQRYDAGGTPVGGEFLVNEYTTADQSEPVVACEADGDFVVAWSGEGPGTGDYGVHGRRFNADGTPKGGDLAIGDGATTPVGLASDAAGNFMVAWDDYWGDAGIHGRAIDATGTPVGPPFVIGPSTGEGNWYPAVSADTLGTFVVAWQKQNGDGDDDAIFARRFDTSGTSLGGAFLVNTETTYRQGNPGVGHDPAGNFLVVWNSDYDDVAARRFDASGTPSGPEFLISNVETFIAYQPIVAAGATDDFLVVWNSGVDDSTDMFGRRVRGDGTLLGKRFRLNTWNAAGDMYGSIAHTQANDFVVAFSSYDVDGSDYGVAAQRVRLPAAVPGCPTQPRTDCHEPTIGLQGKLKIKDKPNDAQDGISWTFAKGEATDLAELGDPTTSDGFAFCLYYAYILAPQELRASSLVGPGGTCTSGPCWKPAGDAGFKYVNRPGNQDGVAKVVVKSGVDGKASVAVKTKGVFADLLEMPIFPGYLPVIAQLHGFDGCWSATFDEAGVTKNDAVVFVAKPSAGTP
jgi:hypothetical protein